MASLAQTLQSDLSKTAGSQPVGPVVVAPAGATVLTVGAGKQYASIAAAVAAARDGAVILIDAGTYTNDFAVISNKITIEGVGGMVNLVASLPPPNRKGILTVDNDVTIENLSFSGSAISDGDGGNGAGIRYEGGQMTLVNDVFRANQNGILAAAVLPQLSVNTITIDHSVFSANGSGSGYTHNLYVGAVDSLVVTNSIFEQAVVGHEFKSRARVNTIEGNIFRDGPAGTASYDIDLPNGGRDIVRGNLVEKGPNAENNAMVHFGGEGIPYAGSSLTLDGNSFVNDKGAAAVVLLNQTAISATLTGNAFSELSLSQIAQGPATATGSTDATGKALADISLIGVLPGNTTVFTDSSPHSITLAKAGSAVQGGGGLLTVADPAGHVAAIGGSGGMVFVEGPGAGGSSISTKAGSVNAITLVGQDIVDSEGTDSIKVGAGNITGLVGGSATIDDGTGSNNWSIKGQARLIGHGGNPVLALAANASLNISGTLGYLQVQDNGGSLAVDIVQGGAAEQFSVSGGAADVHVYGATIIIATPASTEGAVIRLDAGTAQISSLGPDTIWTGSGDSTVIVSGRAVVHAGTGALSIFGRSDQLGATVYGNGGDYVLDGDTGNITYYGGARASTVRAHLSNNTLVGGAGRLTVLGGSRETITGGTGGLTYTATDGGGANVITTAAGAQNTLTLAGADVVTSRGTDTIYGGTANQSLTIYGNTGVFGSTGNSTIDFYGHDYLVGRGVDTCVVHAGAAVTFGAGTFTSVTETSANVVFSVKAGAFASKVSLYGGAATITGGSTAKTTISTQAGARTYVELNGGTADLVLRGTDGVQAGVGNFTVAITTANTSINGGSGTIAISNQDWVAGDRQTIHGGSGALSYVQGPGALTFIGGSGRAVLDGGWGSMAISGGSGALDISGGGAGLQFVAGSGSATIAIGSGGGDITFGSGTTSVQAAGWGKADIFRFKATDGGGSDVITGFRAGTDRLLLSGVAVASQRVESGSTLMTLTDNTHLQLVGVATRVTLG